MSPPSSSTNGNTPTASSSSSSTTTGSSFTTHKSFSELVPLYDGFILDQFGVMHNGTHALDGASDCVSELAKSGKKLIILSNTSSSSQATIDKLPKLGFDPQYFVGAVTSGEEASHYIASTYGKPRQEGKEGEVEKKKKALWFTWRTPKVPSPHDFLIKCGDIEPTVNVNEADFVMTHGADVLRGPGLDGEATEVDLGSFATDGDFDVIDPVLRQCREHNLPMVCANPDFVMVNPDGTKGHMPGKIAQRYEEIGGKCIYFGKPHVPHFEACIRELGLPKDRVAHVGDSLHHDVAGANASGIPSVFVAGGVHREELGSELGVLPENDALEEVFKRHGQTPTHVVPMLKMDC